MVYKVLWCHQISNGWSGVDGREWLSLLLILVVFMYTVYNCCLCHYHWALCSVKCFLSKVLYYTLSLSRKRMYRSFNSILDGIEAREIEVASIFPLERFSHWWFNTLIQHLAIYIPFQASTSFMMTSPHPPQLGYIPLECIHPLLNPTCLNPWYLLDPGVAPHASSPLDDVNVAVQEALQLV